MPDMISKFKKYYNSDRMIYDIYKKYIEDFYEMKKQYSLEDKKECHLR